MTNKEIETRLLNLEKMVSNLAERTSNRDNTNEGNISAVSSNADTAINEAEFAEAQAMYTALMTDTLIDEDDTDASLIGGEENVSED